MRERRAVTTEQSRWTDGRNGDDDDLERVLTMGREPIDGIGAVMHGMKSPKHGPGVKGAMDPIPAQSRRRRRDAKMCPSWQPVGE